MLFPAKRKNPLLAYHVQWLKKALSPSGLKFPSLGDQFSWLGDINVAQWQC